LVPDNPQCAFPGKYKLGVHGGKWECNQL
jgi:hypothetical protein